MNITKGHIYWLVHEKSQLPVGFVRLLNNGALVLGGKSGTHFTGHGESYWQKFKELISWGYIPKDIAIDLRLLPSDWRPPVISSSTEREWLDKIKNGEM